MANQMETDCPWERHWDEGSGLYFYFNPTTETSEWEVPAGWEAYFAERDAEDAATGAAAIPASAEEGGEDTRVVVQEASSVAESSGASATVSPEDDTATTNDSGSGTGGDAHDEEQDDLAVEGVNTLASVGRPAAEADAPPSCAWIKTEDESGNVYYYNQTTEESSWEEPPEYTRFHAASRENEESGHAEAEAVAKMEEDAEGRDDRMEEDGQEEEEEEEDEEEEEEEAEEEEDEEEEEEEEEEKEEEEYSHFPAVVSPITPDANMMAHEHQRQNTGGTAVATRSGSRVRRDYPSPEPDAFGGVRVASPTYDWQGGEGSPSSSPEGSHSFGDSLSPPSGATGWAGYSIGELSPILENIDAAASDLGGLNKEVRWGVGAETLTGKENGKTLTQEQKKEKIQRAKRIAADREHQLDESDAIMEVDCYTRVVEYQNALGSLKRLKGEHNNNKETLNQSMKKLIAGYQGYAQQTLLVNSWLCMASEVQEEDTEDMMVNELKELIKENFDAKKADGILDSGKGVPSWLTAMQADDGWRRTLIELAKEHRGSALLRFVLKQLSDRGHHREIASVISETDLFSVFNGVLKDALARIPADDEEDIDRAMDDLKRMCCSTSYMFMYSQQLLLDLEATARAEAKPTPPTRREETLLEAGAKAEVNTDAKKPACVADDGSNRRTSSRKQQRTAKKPRGDQDASTERRQVARAIAARKFKRLRQELTNHTCDMGGSKGSTGLTNPRQGPGTGSGFPSVAFVTDVERAFSEGSRVLRPPTTAASHAMDAERVASSAVISLLGQVGWKRPGAKGLASGGVAGRRTAVLSEAVEALVSAYGLGAARRAAVEGVAKQLPADDVVRPSALLVRHESVINILLEALFDPTQRSPSEDVKTGSSAILAYASCVEVKLPGVAGGGKGERGGPAKDEVDLVELSQTSHALMQAGNRCFEKRPSRPASLQGRLRPFAEYPVVSLGIMKWIHAQVSTEAFCSTPRFLSDAPMFLKLCKHTVDDHPPQRPEVFEILKYILNARMAPDTPASSRNNLKKQVLLHMADVVMKGYVIPVLAYVHKLAVETSLESSVLGYFVLRIIEAAGPREDTGKYSPAFLNGVGALVGVPRVRQALQGNKLSTLDENRLSNFFRFCMRFQSTDFTKEGMEAIVELRSDLGSS